MNVRTLFALAIFYLASNSLIADERPTRSECIVGFALNWAQVKSDPREVRREMYYWRPRHVNAPELAGTSMKPDGSRIYLQYRRHCEEKQQMAADLIGFWRSQGLDLPEFERLPEPIIPSTDTIDFRGPEWRDPETPVLDLQDRPTNL